MARYEGRHRNALAPSTAPRPNPATSSARSGATRHEAAPELSEAAAVPRSPRPVVQAAGVGKDGARAGRDSGRVSPAEDAVARLAASTQSHSGRRHVKSLGPQASRRQTDPGRRPRRRPRRLRLRLRQGQQHHRCRQRRVRRRQRRRRPDRRDGARRHRRHELPRGRLGLAQRAPHRHLGDRPAHGHGARGQEEEEAAKQAVLAREAAARAARDQERQRVIANAQNDPKSAARLLMADHGWGSDAQYNCLVNLWTGESDWRWSATNASSGAYGIPQSLPPTRCRSSVLTTGPTR